MNNINLKTAAQSVLPDTGTVCVVFLTDVKFKNENTRETAKKYTYLAPLDVVSSLSFGDYAVAIAHGEPQVVRVLYTRTNTDELDLNSDWDHQWLIARVPMERKEALYDRDKTCYKRLKQRQQRIMREQILQEGIGLSHDELKLMIEGKKDG